MLFASRILTVSLLLPHISTLAAKCNHPDGNQVDSDVSFFADDAFSECCTTDEVVSTKNLCGSVKKQVNDFARRSCLDASFGGTCPDFCKGSTNDSAKVEVYQCGDPALGQFCCDEGEIGSSCCSEQSNIIMLERGISFGGGDAPASVITSTSVVRTSIISKSATSLNFVTSIISQHSTTSKLSTTSRHLATASIISLSSVSSQTRSSSIRLVTSQVQVSSSHIPTTIPKDFTTLPSPVFSSVFVPTSTTLKKTTTTSKAPLTTASIVLPLSTSSQNPISQNQTTTTSSPLGTAASASDNGTLIPTSKRLNSQAIIAGTVGGAVAVFLIAFFMLLLRQQQKRAKALSPRTAFFAESNFKSSLNSRKGSKDNDKGSIRSLKTDYSVQTAFGYKPPSVLATVQKAQPEARLQSQSAEVDEQEREEGRQLSEREMGMGLQRSSTERSNDTVFGAGDISVPIVFISDSRHDSSIRSADIRSIEEQLERMSDTRYSVAAATSASDERNRRMTPGSDFNVFADPPESLRSGSRMSGASRISGGSRMGGRKGHRYRDSDGFVDEREGSGYGYTPEELNRVGGTGYGQRFKQEGQMDGEEETRSEVGTVGSLEGMEGRIPARLSGLSERSTTYKKLLFDVQSQPF